jgi:hypothetical protein
MKKLILITVFVLLGTLVNSAMAAKPRPEPTPETITLAAGPLSYPTNCGVVNNTDSSIVVRINWCAGAKDNTPPVYCYSKDDPDFGLADVVIGPGHYEADHTLWVIRGDYSVTCELTYAGFPNDITGVYCGKDDNAGATVCLPLQAR